MAGSGAQTIVLFITSSLLSTFRFHIHHCFSHPPSSILLSCHLVPLHVFLAIIFTIPPHHHAVILGLVGPNGISPMWPNPIIPNSTPNPELVTIGTNFECSTRGLVHPCCLHCTKAMVNNPALMCHHPTWWVNCLHCYWQHNKCHNVSAPVSVLALLIHHIGPKHLFPDPAPSAGGGGCLARG